MASSHQAQPRGGLDEATGAVPEDRLEVQALLLAADEDAFREIYERYSPLVRGLAARITRDHSAADDVVQEVFVRLWESPLSYDPARGPLRAWLGVVAHRRAVDWVRREERHRRTAEPPAPSGHDETADAVTARLEALGVRSAAARLPDTLRTPLLLAYYGSRTYRQVAGDLGIPEGTAKTRLRAALRALAAALAEEGITP
ncbi:sigma-70 family RNA polymerase sigma factor [Streptomyces sp. NRRL B-1347]|uniref:sigma-70 family RNA polymerase sigma factor n=1 Tax=Streptomyces sp. NRRL B-1347 TaxID=1476877 RepID=UPI00099C6DF7|nr:sigma-70 family RNA polymerase sigma factor [Streptomyces sp. NRRL B-1347]